MNRNIMLKVEDLKRHYTVEVDDEEVQTISVLKGLNGLSSSTERNTKYLLYDAGMAVYTHIGNSVLAEKYYKKCTEIADAVGLEDYLTTRNLMVVSCCDCFDLDRAETISAENISYQEVLSDVKKEIHISDISENGSVSLGRTYSQDAQILAFLRDKRAEAQFQNALNCFLYSSVDYKITQSYLLHFYLDNYEKGRYRELCCFSPCKSLLH